MLLFLLFDVISNVKLDVAMAIAISSCLHNPLDVYSDYLENN